MNIVYILEIGTEMQSMYMLYSHNNDHCCLKIATLWEYAMHSIQACEASRCTIKACKSLPKHVSCQMKLSISVFKLMAI